jgi:hypothetical protein
VTQWSVRFPRSRQAASDAVDGGVTILEVNVLLQGFFEECCASLCFARRPFAIAAGWSVVERAAFSRALSCTTSVSFLLPAVSFACSGKTFLINRGFPLLTMDRFAFSKVGYKMCAGALGYFCHTLLSPQKRRSSLVSMLPRFPSLPSRTSFRFENV